MSINRFGMTSIVALLAGTGTTVFAAEASIEYIDVERIQVIGKSTDRAKIPGAATRLSPEDLEEFKYQDILRTLRLVPGVNIQEEDGYGLRPNIGLRGSGVDRSAKITLMEDGVLISPAPYAAPSAYYFPTTARMEAVEVRKGSAAVKFGPRTVGGAVNLVSRSIPEELGGFADLRYGTDDQLTTHAAVGGSTENFGGMVEYFRSKNDGFKELPNGGNTGFDVEDYLAKFRIQTSTDAEIKQSLEIKLSYTDGDSNETYLGITDADFRENPYQRYAASALDNIDTKHEQVQLTHHIAFGNDIEVITTAYRNEFERDWFKFQDLRDTTDQCGSTNGAFILENGDICATEIAWIKGEADSVEGAVRIRHNARQYLSKGIQSLVAIPFATGTAEHDIEISARYHEDYEDRLQFNERYTMLDGTLVYSSQDNLGDAGNRIVDAKAWAFFVQDTISVGKWTIVPGVRFESIELNRTDWSNDPTRATVGSSRPEANIDAVVPGLGISYRLNDNLTLTGGVYKGFNPPGAGSADVQEEESVNVEAGMIFDQNGFFGEGMVFYSDYSNILGECTAASGQPGDCDIGDQFNGGAARIFGIEFTGGYSFMLSDSLTVPLTVNYTYTDAQFSTSFTDSFWGTVEKGDAFPYLAKHQLTATAGLEADGWRTKLLFNYVSATRTEAGTGAIPSLEKVDDRLVVDFSAHMNLMDNLELFANIDNLFDNEYAVARRPIGVRPGKPRTFIGGVKYTF